METHLENVKESTGVKTRLLVSGSEQSSLLAAVGSEGSGEIELETLGEVVLGLDLSTEDV